MTTDIFTDVPVDDLQHPLLSAEMSRPDNQEDQINVDQATATTTMTTTTTACTMFWRYATTAHFLMGTTLGIVLSTTGFELLLRSVVAPITTLHIVLFSCAWSFGTYFLAYLLFAALHSNNNNSNKNRNKNKSSQCSEQNTLHERWEYVYALGVFVGFCFACAVTDVHYGMPVRSLTWTLGLAIIWLIVMIVFLFVQEKDKSREIDGSDSRDDDDDNKVGRGMGEEV